MGESVRRGPRRAKAPHTSRPPPRLCCRCVAAPLCCCAAPRRSVAANCRRRGSPLRVLLREVAHQLQALVHGGRLGGLGVCRGRKGEGEREERGRPGGARKAGDLCPPLPPVCARKGDADPRDRITGPNGPSCSVHAALPRARRRAGGGSRRFSGSPERSKNAPVAARTASALRPAGARNADLDAAALPRRAVGAEVLRSIAGLER